MQSIMTNGVMPDALKDIEESCETLMNHINVQIKHLRSYSITKIINQYLQKKNGNERAVIAMKALHK